MTHRFCLIPGDGIGPEVTAAARRVLDATGVDIEWQIHDVGDRAFRAEGTALPSRVVEAVASTGVALKGPVATSQDAPYRSPNVELRERLDLYLGVRPCRSLPGARPSADLALLRMHAGDLYAGYEWGADAPTAVGIRRLVEDAGAPPLPDDAGLSLKPISRSASKRAAQAAFAWVRRNGRRHITVVHKANVMRESDGAFLDAVRSVAGEFPEVEVDDGLVDRVCADLVRAPGRYDVLLAPMLYGDILSDLAAALCGGLGVAPGANVGDRCSVFEAAHGTCEKLAGQNRANPIALILSGAMMLRHIGEAAAAERVERAVEDVVKEGSSVTYDLAAEDVPAATTVETSDAVARRL